jgi:hypothetical protein
MAVSVAGSREERIHLRTKRQFGCRKTTDLRADRPAPVPVDVRAVDQSMSRKSARSPCTISDSRCHLSGTEMTSSLTYALTGRDVGAPTRRLRHAGRSRQWARTGWKAEPLVAVSSRRDRRGDCTREVIPGSVRRHCWLWLVASRSNIADSRQQEVLRCSTRRGQAMLGDAADSGAKHRSERDHGTVAMDEHKQLVVIPPSVETAGRQMTTDSYASCETAIANGGS